MFLTRVSELIEEHWPIYVIAALAVVAILIIVIVSIVLKKKKENFDAGVTEAGNSIRVFIVDAGNDSVSFFNLNSLRNVKTTTLNGFYRQFPAFEQQKIMNWIHQLTDGETTPQDFLETDVTDSKAKKRYFSVLRVTHLDKEKKVAHIVSYMMNFMSAPKGSKVPSQATSSLLEYRQALKSTKKNGYSSLFRICYKNIAQKDKEIERLLLTQIKNAIYPYAIGNKKYLISVSGNEFLFCDISITDKTKVIIEIKTLLSAIKKFLLINSLEDKIDVRVGVVPHHKFSRDGDAVIEQARITAQSAYEDEKTVLFYEKKLDEDNSFGDSAYRTEVERIISERKLDYAFRPIFYFQKESVIGYFLDVKPKDTYFESMEELKEYAVRTDDDRQLFSMIVKNTVPHFIAQRPSQHSILFYPVRSYERGYMLSTFTNVLKNDMAQVAFVIPMEDLLYSFNAAHFENTVNDLRAIKAKGFMVALELGEDAVGVPSDLLKVFDFFIASFAFKGPASEQDAAVRSNLHALVEKLLKFKKPIIANDIEGWPSIELVVRSGVSYVSSETLAPFDPMILPLSPKAIKRVKEMKK